MRKRLLLITVLVLSIVAVLYAAYSTSNYNEQGGARLVIGGDIDIVSGGEINIEDGGKLYMEPTDDLPTAAIGWIYFDLSETALTYHNGSGWVFLAAGTGDNTLDLAYDQGSSGGGAKIDADTGPVEIEVDDASTGSGGNYNGLHIDYDDVTNDGTPLHIESDVDAANAPAIDVDGQTTGRDFEGTGASSYITGAGLGYFTTGQFAGDITLENGLVLDQTTNNSWGWTENSEDIVWTFSNDTITASSTTGVVSIDWGSIAPTFGSTIVASSGMTSSDDITLANGKALKTSTTSGQTAKLQVYDNDTGPGYKDALTLTNGNTPSLSLGGNAMTVAVDSTDWDISVTGAMTGIGAITADGLITGSAGATISGGAVNLNASSNNAVNIGTGTTTSTVTVGGAAAQTINIGDGAAAKIVTLGSSNSTSTTTILSGSGTLLLNNDNNQATLIGTGTSTGTVTVGGAAAQTINVGDGAAAKTVTLGSSNSTSTTTILSGSGTLLLNNDNNQNTLIGTGTTTGSVTVGGAGAQTIAVGDGAAAKTVSLGSSNTTSTTTLLSGSGTLKLNVDNNQATNIGTGTSTGTVTVGGAAAQSITIGNGAAAKTVTLGSSNSTSTTNILAGSGGINITGSVVRTSQQYVQSIAYAKVGAGAGWVVGAANNVSLATLPQSQTSSTMVIPITVPLKIGWTITAFSINGQIDSAGNAATLDADLRKHTEATAGYADASIGAITQISKTADYKVADSKGSLAEVVAADESYYILIDGTTGGTTDIEIASITVTVSEI